MTNQQVQKEIVNEIKCTCGECEKEGNYYLCKGCNRLAPYCFGAADKYFDYCDDCAVELMKDDEEKILKNAIV